MERIKSTKDESYWDGSLTRGFLKYKLYFIDAEVPTAKGSLVGTCGKKDAAAREGIMERSERRVAPPQGGKTANEIS